MNNEKIFTTPIEFSEYIEAVVNKNKTTHMQAILDYCEHNFIDPKDIVHLVNKQMKSKIKDDATKLNFFRS